MQTNHIKKLGYVLGIMNNGKFFSDVRHMNIIGIRFISILIVGQYMFIDRHAGRQFKGYY